MKRTETGFTLIEMVVTVAILAIATAMTAPIITRNRWQGEVDRYASMLESGLYGLRAKLGARKTSCIITFPATFNFAPPNKLVEFSQSNSNNQTSFQCCDSEISRLKQDPDCNIGHPGYQLSSLTNRPLDNLRLLLHESTPESNAVRVAVSGKEFGFTPPGTTANSGTLTFLICHNRSQTAGSTSRCLPDHDRLKMRCVQIDGTGAIAKGTWEVTSPLSPTSSGTCKKQ